MNCGGWITDSFNCISTCVSVFLSVFPKTSRNKHTMICLKNTMPFTLEKLTEHANSFRHDREKLFLSGEQTREVLTKGPHRPAAAPEPWASHCWPKWTSRSTQEQWGHLLPAQLGIPPRPGCCGASAGVRGQQDGPALPAPHESTGAPHSRREAPCAVCNACVTPVPQTADLWVPGSLWCQEASFKGLS